MSIDLKYFQVGMKITAKAGLREGKTKPPSLFMEGDLVSVMDDIGKYANIGKDDMQTLKQANKSGTGKAGIGTARTRGDIIKNLFDKKYFDRIKKNNKEYVIPTEKALRLYDLLSKYHTGSVLVSPELTAKWESGLEKIESGAITIQQFMSKLVPMIEEVVREIMANPTVERGQKTTRRKIGENEIKPHPLDGQICDKCKKGNLKTGLVTNPQSARFGNRYVFCSDCKYFGEFIE